MLMPKMATMPGKPMPDEGGAPEQDAVSSAFDAIRASIDAAERELVMAKFRKPDPDAASESPAEDAAEPGEEV